MCNSAQASQTLRLLGSSTHMSVKMSFFAFTLRSWLNLHLNPFWHLPALKYSHTMDLGSTPARGKAIVFELL